MAHSKDAPKLPWDLDWPDYIAICFLAFFKQPRKGLTRLVKVFKAFVRPAFQWLFEWSLKGTVKPFDRLPFNRTQTKRALK